MQNKELLNGNEGTRLLIAITPEFKVYRWKLDDITPSDIDKVSNGKFYLINESQVEKFKNACRQNYSNPDKMHEVLKQNFEHFSLKEDLQVYINSINKASIELSNTNPSEFINTKLSELKIDLKDLRNIKYEHGDDFFSNRSEFKAQKIEKISNTINILKEQKFDDLSNKRFKELAKEFSSYSKEQSARNNEANAIRAKVMNMERTKDNANEFGLTMAPPSFIQNN